MACATTTDCDMPTMSCTFYGNFFLETFSANDAWKTKQKQIIQKILIFVPERFHLSISSALDCWFVAELFLTFVKMAYFCLSPNPSFSNSTLTVHWNVRILRIVMVDLHVTVLRYTLIISCLLNSIKRKNLDMLYQ